MIWEGIVAWFNREPKPLTKQTAAPPTHKVCSACKEEKLLSDYYEKESGYRSSSMCKTCYRAKLKKKNKEKASGKTI